VEEVYLKIAILADKYKDKVIALAKELCTIPSPSGSEITKVRFIKDLLDKTYDGKGIIDEEDNLIYTVKGKDSSKCILLCAHT
jgi:putative aminopeptidase FrvX